LTSGTATFPPREQLEENLGVLFADVLASALGAPPGSAGGSELDSPQTLMLDGAADRGVDRLSYEVAPHKLRCCCGASFFARNPISGTSPTVIAA